MQIKFSTCYLQKNYQISAPRTVKKVSKVNETGVSLGCTNEIYFKGQLSKPAKIGFTNLEKITSEAEYDRVFNKLVQSGYWLSWWNDGDKFEKGLRPYVGKEDISYRINDFLRTGKANNEKYPKDMLECIIRLMDYSLGKLDKKYGKYTGIVYRYGVTETVSKSFVSTTRKPESFKWIIPDDDMRQFSQPFFIIYCNQGHRIDEMKKPKCDIGFDRFEENEILLDPTHFEIIKEPSSEMLVAEEKLCDALKKEHFYRKPQINFLKEF